MSTTYQQRFTALNFLYFQNMHAEIHLKEKLNVRMDAVKAKPLPVIHLIVIHAPVTLI